MNGCYDGVIGEPIHFFSLDSMSTDRSSMIHNVTESGSNFSCGIKGLCGYYRYVVSHDFSRR